MENYSYGSYPESGESSPRSREMEFENPPACPWEEQKVKFMCSYGGKIQPRPHDNQLSYMGGHTKILAVERSVSFSSLLSKLSSLMISGGDVSFKYQLPGEDLDALISVTNDDDLDHLMHEYDRLFRATSKHARMRLFLFSEQQPINTESPKSTNADDFLFGLNKPPAKMQEEVMTPPGYRRDVESDQTVEMQRQLQRMQIGNDIGYAPPPVPPADYYVPKMPENIHMAPPPVSPPPGGFWAEKQLDQQQMYMVQAQAQAHQGGGPVYHTPVQRPPVNMEQGGYYVQRMNSHDLYREQQQPPQVYSMAPQPQMTAPPPKVTAYSEGFAAVPRPGAAYTAQLAYDNGMGRQVYYNAQPVPLQPPQQQYQGGSSDTRSGAAKLVTKVSHV